MDTPPIAQGDPEVAAFWLRFLVWVVAALQIIGGLFGYYYALMSSPNINHFVLLAAFVLFGASVWGGVLLALDRSGGVIVSLIIQTLQAIQIITGSINYSFVCGFGLFVNLYAVGMNFQYYYPARITFYGEAPSNSSQVGPLFLSVNLVAVLAIACLMLVRSARSQLLLAQAKVLGKVDKH